jgi:peptidoglycan/LPS O-acetylase OafA/YrhL
MRRIKELDSIRGLAALSIVFFHLRFQAISILGTPVDLFFVLSGYLITTIILTNSLNDNFLLSFYARRALRIWPIYYLTLLALVVIYPFLPPCGNLHDLPYYLTFTQELPRYRPTVDPSFPSAFRHTWTLAIEEQFYLIWPPLIWWLGKKRVPIAAASLVILALVARSQNLSAFILATHLDGLVLGGLLAGLLADRDRPAEYWRRFGVRLRVLGVVSAVLYVVATIFPRVLSTTWPGPDPAVMVYIFRPLFLSLAFFALVGTVVLHAGQPRLRLLRDKRLVYLGSISYGLYLYHHFIFEICKYYQNYYNLADALLLDIAKLALSIGLSALSWRYVERPILGLKDRFLYHDVRPPEREVSRTVDDIAAARAG